ncbi:MAG: flagellar hook-length control protein FliK [Oscillospiraceae bacterium]|nr:flagellar hook-length control protein FliK [Oscillospiraceae bacterium]
MGEVQFAPSIIQTLIGTAGITASHEGESQGFAEIMQTMMKEAEGTILQSKAKLAEKSAPDQPEQQDPVGHDQVDMAEFVYPGYIAGYIQPQIVDYQPPEETISLIKAPQTDDSEHQDTPNGTQVKQPPQTAQPPPVQTGQIPEQDQERTEVFVQNPAPMEANEIPKTQEGILKAQTEQEIPRTQEGIPKAQTEQEIPKTQEGIPKTQTQIQTSEKTDIPQMENRTTQTDRQLPETDIPRQTQAEPHEAQTTIPTTMTEVTVTSSEMRTEWQTHSAPIAISDTEDTENPEIRDQQADNAQSFINRTDKTQQTDTGKIQLYRSHRGLPNDRTTEQADAQTGTRIPEQKEIIPMSGMQTGHTAGPNQNHTERPIIQIEWDNEFILTEITTGLNQGVQTKNLSQDTIQHESADMRKETSPQITQRPESMPEPNREPIFQTKTESIFYAKANTESTFQTNEETTFHANEESVPEAENRTSLRTEYGTTADTEIETKSETGNNIPFTQSQTIAEKETAVQKSQQPTVRQTETQPTKADAMTEKSETKPLETAKQTAETPTQEKAITTPQQSAPMPMAQTVLSNTDTVFVRVGDGANILSEGFAETAAEKIIYSAQNGIEQFEMQLNPRELGKITINITFQAGKAIVTMICQNQRAQSLLGLHTESIRQIVEENTGNKTTILTQQEENPWNKQDNLDGRSNGRQRQQQRESKPKQEEVSDFMNRLRLGMLTAVNE